MRLNTIQAYWKKGWISFIISAITFFYLLNLTWLKWGDLVVDLGREMYVPQELASGRLLYRDIFYIYGPFSPYFNSFLFKLFGAHIHSLILSGVITICAVSILIYKISRVFLNVFFSTFAVLTFLFVFAFGHYTYNGNYNFILPYSYPAIHGVMFSLGALYFYYLSLFKGIRKHKFFYLIAVAVTFLCKIEIGIALIFSIIISLGIYFISRKERFKKILSQSFIYLILPLGCAIFVYSLFFIASGEVIEKSNLFDIGRGCISIKDGFTKWLFGASDIFGNIFIMVKTFLYYILFSIFFGLGGFILTYVWRKRRLRLLSRIFLSFLISTISIWLGFIFFKKLFPIYDLQYRSLPIICLLTIFISLWKFIKDKKRVEDLFIISVSIFSLFLMFRMLFHVWAGHYGFYILVPGVIVYYVFFLKIAAGALKSNIARRFFKVGFIFIFTLFIMSHFSISRFCYKLRTLKISSKRGDLYVFNNDKERRCKELISFLGEHTDRKETVVIIAEGLAINFLSERKNPLYYYSYLNIDLDKKDVLDRIISDMESEKVDYVAWMHNERGYIAFGKDYGKELKEYILENYVLYRQFGPFPSTSEKYGIALFKRKT